MQSGQVLSLSPSFNNYSSTNLADIAARVVEEFRAESESQLDDLYPDFKQDEKTSINRASEEDEKKADEEEEDDDDFAFPSVFVEQNLSPIPADEIFHNGQIRPVFPLFNTDLLLDDAELVNSTKPNTKPPKPPAIRLPLRKLFSEERDTPSCSSSDGDELDGVRPESYCVWTPKPAAECKKSNSTGSSSKRWKFRDLLYRSNSEGKNSFVFLSHSNSNSKKRDEKVEKVEKTTKVAGNVKAKVAAVGGEEGNYTKDDGGMKEGDRRRSYLPYKKDLVGFFANVNGMSRNLHPF